MNDKTYRKNVGLIVLNPENQLLVCKRKDTKKWQFPQGGVDSNEKPIQAAYRELFEEVGISKKDVKLLKESEHWYKYDLPVDYRRKTINLKKEIDMKSAPAKMLKKGPLQGWPRTSPKMTHKMTPKGARVAKILSQVGITEGGYSRSCSS